MNRTRMAEPRAATLGGCSVAAVLRVRGVAAALPGDDVLSHADVTATRGITIRATVDEVWPWIAQLGQGRGGFYSYDRLENLLGCDIHSSDRVVSRWQRVRVGDQFRLHPTVALAVTQVETGRFLVLRGGVPIGRAPAPYDFSWAFVLRGESDGTTRLLVRERYRYSRPWAALIVEPASLVSFVMSERMLRGIKQRAQRAPTARPHDHDAPRLVPLPPDAQRVA